VASATPVILAPLNTDEEAFAIRETLTVFWSGDGLCRPASALAIFAGR